MNSFSRIFFSSNNQLTTKVKCESTFMLLASRCSSLWARLLGVVRMNWKARLLSVLQVLQVGQSVSLQSRRHLAGLVLLGWALGSIFAHQFLFNPYVEDHQVCGLLGFTPQDCIKETGWCYVSWFYYWHTIRFCVAAIFGAVGMILFVPTKYSLSFIPFSILQSLGWVGLIHYSFFARSFETYHTLPHWTIIAIGLALGFSIVMSLDYLLYWTNHKKRGNWQRFAGVTEMDLPAEQKEPLYKQLAQEYRQINKMI